MTRPLNGDHVREIGKLLRSIHEHNLYPLFGDCVESAAIAISNAVDFGNRSEREARYMEHANRYGSDTMGVFANVFAHVTMALEEQPTDVLGQVFHQLELHNDARGQFFTPYDLCRMMAEMQLDDELDKRIEERGFITVQEPACGSGAMVIALAEAMHKRGINYQKHLHVTAIDVDSRAAHMAYIQLSLLHIPAVVWVGNTLSMEMREAWCTPAHIMGGWRYRLAAEQSAADAVRLERPPAAVVSTPVEPSGTPGVQLGFDLGL